ncbi:MAG: hypothetical protein FJ010_06115 [Chloroflexi bacterium]|nr:hypothetical protein [Chloroflexota bacterium]
MKKKQLFFHLTTRKLAIAITFLAVFAMAARISVDTDTWWHLRAGQWIIENRAAPQQDPFSYTRLGERWQYPGWLVEVPMVVIYQAFGPGGLNIWTAAMVALTFGFVWMTLTGGEFLRAFAIILAAAASGVYWAARPYLVTFLFAAVYLWVLEDGRRTADGGPQSAVGRRWSSGRLWLLPLLMVVWANSHGGFAMGFVLWGVYFVDALVRWRAEMFEHANVRTLAIVGSLMVVGVCINPSGLAMLLYPIKTVGIGVLQDFIQEWQPPNFHERQVQPFLWLLLLTFGAVGASRRRIFLTDFLLASGFVYLSLRAGRNIALFALAAPMVLTRHAAPWLQEAGERLGIRGFAQPPVRTSQRQSILNWILLVALILAVGVKSSLVIPRSASEAYFEETLPVSAVVFLREEWPEGRLFNSYNWGGYLTWALPEYPVFVDGRTDLYGDELIGQWVQVVQAEEGWQEVLDEWDVGVILLEPFRPVVDELAEEGWDLLYKDDIAVVYGR